MIKDWGVSLLQFEQSFSIQMADFFPVDLADRGCFNEPCHDIKRCIRIICRKEDMI
jgi:hypothetical protein